MKESVLNLGPKSILIALIVLYSLNILLHLFCIGLISYAVTIGLVEDDAIYYFYIFLILPFSIFLALLIVIFNHEKKKKGVEYENYMLLFPLSFFFTFCLSFWVSNLRDIINTIVVLLSIFGVVISFRVIRNLYAGLNDYSHNDEKYVDQE